ncbi:MAG: hypothetical protein GEU78_18695 [Actinobacteria bacterium]|nr:hypothetical protein [Actinomycetota bacterium]
MTGPFLLVFVGTAWSEPTLLAFAYAYEQAAQVWQPPSEINPSAFRCPTPTAPDERTPLVVGACPS